LDWFLLALVAYWIGQVISVMETKAEHPDRHLLPCAILGLAWPYLAVRRCIAQWRRDKRSQW